MVLLKKRISFEKIPRSHWIKKAMNLDINVVNDSGEEVSKFKVKNGEVEQIFNFINHKKIKSRNGFCYHAIHDYNPCNNIEYNLKIFEKKQRDLILDFKKGKNSLQLAEIIIEVLEHLFKEKDLKNTIIVPIPASTKEDTEIRYSKILEIIEEKSEIKSGYDLIEIDENVKSKHRGNKSRKLKFTLDTEELKGKNIILLDDIITTGVTFQEMCKKITDDIEPLKLEGLFIGKTIKKK